MTNQSPINRLIQGTGADHTSRLRPSSTRSILVWSGPGLEAQRQYGRAALAPPGAALDLAFEREAGGAAEELLDRDPELLAGDRRADAAMGTVPEHEVAIRGAIQQALVS